MRSSVRPASPHSQSRSVDGNYIFTPPKDDANQQELLDRPRLEPLDIAFHNDGTLRSIFLS
jgi:hypothetical protein